MKRNLIKIEVKMEAGWNSKHKKKGLATMVLFLFDNQTKLIVLFWLFFL
jgi:hypothetical protein